MGRIKKAAGPKHEATVSPAVSSFVSKASSFPVSALPEILDSFPKRWPLPRGDLYHWIPLLNRFDNILEQFIKVYGLDAGPQSKPFGTILLNRGIAAEDGEGIIKGTSREELESLHFGDDGDRQLVEDILQFSRTLLENCGNRSLYGSSERLSELLNTTSLPLLSNVLQLMIRLAQRYHASRQRTPNANQNLNNALLASHYNIDLDKVQRLAEPFVKLPSPYHTTNQTPAGKKGKDKATTSGHQNSASNANDMLSLIQPSDAYMNGSAKLGSKAGKQETQSVRWEDWGGVSLTYYPIPVSKDDTRHPTPTPSRRGSSLSKPSRLSSSDENADASPTASNEKPEGRSTAMANVEITAIQIKTTSIEDLMSNPPSEMPKDVQYDLLTRVRVAHAIMTSVETRQELVGIRLLALANLAYIYTEETFRQKILQRDSDEPRNLQLVHLLCDMLHPPANKPNNIPIKLQSFALGALESFAKLKTMAPDVCIALSVNVNHGVLFLLLRKAVADMGTEITGTMDVQLEEWREAIFALLDTLPTSTPRTGEALISAGVLGILVELLNLRTSKAERSFPKTLTFLNNLIAPARDAFQTLANANGLEAISDLMAHEVKTSIQRAENGQGLQPGFRNRVVDYQIPFFSQQTLRMIFKIIREMMTNNSGNFDRLLRNFIDSPSLLGGLRTVIVNPKVFGSNVWSGAVNIMSSFIHNEPTSYAVISEAGLSKGLLETLSTKPVPSVKANQTDDGTEESHGGTAQAIDDADDLPDISADTEKLMTYFSSKMKTEIKPEGVSLAKGVLPATEPIIAIPHAFGALCLNRAGMDMLKKTDALDSFFEIFESPAHVKVMKSEQELGQLIGQALEELVRHHPTLKILVLSSVIKMINRVKNLCLALGKKNDIGAKICLQGNEDKRMAVGKAESADGVTEMDGDVLMSDLDTSHEPSAIPKALDSTPSDEDEEEDPNILNYISAAMRFLSGFAENQAISNLLVDSGIVELILEIVTLPVLVYNHNTHAASVEIRRVLHVFAEAKPHLVLPTLLQHTQSAVDRLAPLQSHAGTDSFFAEFISPELTSNKSTPSSNAARGTAIVKSLVSVHTLCNILGEIFSHPPFNTRTTQTPFSLVNLADVYIKLIKDLGSLHRVCVWEEILLMKRLPESWTKATQVHGYGITEPDKTFGFSNSDDALRGLDSVPEISGPSSSSPGNAATSSTSKKSLSADDQKSAAFQNFKILRYLLGQIPATATPFFRSLGRSLLGKRRSHTPDPYLRQNASMVANAISSAYMQMFTYEPPHEAEKMQRYSYWIVILTSLSRLLIEGGATRIQTQVLTLLLQAFRQDGGLNIIRSILEKFHEEVDTLSNSSGAAISKDNAACLFAAYRGIQVILNFYTPILSHKCIVDAGQSEAMRSAESQAGRAFYFNPQQFLVDLQITILPVIKSLWESTFVEKASSEIIKSVIELMKTILDSSEEHGIPRQNPEITKPTHKVYEISDDKLAWLKGKGIDEDMAHEALYRCMNAQHFALAYCQRLRSIQGASRLPIPEYDKTPPNPESQGAVSANQDAHSDQATQPDSDVAVQSTVDDDTTAAATGLALLSQGDRLTPSMTATPQIAVEESGHEFQASSEMPPPPAPGVPAATEVDAGGRLEMSLDNLQNMLPDVQAQATADLFQRLNESLAGSFNTGSQTHEEHPATVASTRMTIEDLNNARNDVRKTLVDRALDVLNAHDDVTFELADLISTATSKATDVKAVRAEIGATLIQSLISFELGEDFATSGKKIAAYANLLALVLQNKEFFEACSNDLKDNFAYLIGFVHLPPNQTAGMSTTPWIAQTLLVIERILAEDAQPPQIKWTPPDPGGSLALNDATNSGTALVSEDVKAELFEALLKLMPSTGKDESMVLSIVRVLVMITRSRDVASKLAEKKNIQRFFLMIKQLSGMNDDKLTSSVMVVIRHMFEDDEIIRTVMRSEVRNGFETRANRPTDATNYARQNNHLAIRSPHLFVQISNEVLEITGYDSTQRPQALKLKQDEVADALALTDQAEASSTEDANKNVSEDQHMIDKVQSEDDVQTVNPKSKTSEKAPVVESPSGVIHYLLSELLSYKDTDDSVTPLPAKPVKGDSAASSANETPSDSNGRMAPHSQSPATEPSAEAVASTTSSNSPLTDAKKAELKPEQHPIHTYRCFLLQCLTELLHSYNQAKIEFINFSRKADAKATTPSKPRSGVLNYLLMDAIPIAALQAEDTIAYKKKEMTSTWAMSTIVALCLRTNEYGYDGKPGTIEEDDQPDLVFVRKFVLEHALKAYKDANSSDEDLIIKYGRLLKLAELFYNLLSGALVTKNVLPSTGGLEMGPQKAIAKLMFEKNFIAALTSSVADISLNLKGADRAVKYILRPLKQLTATAVELSESASISTIPGQNDEDNISSASSVSEVDGREETPDLYHNSTLGMFEANREDDSSSDSSRSEDDEMYEDEYDEGIDYDDGLAEPDNDEVVSDEDEELEDVGDIEGFHGEGPGPMEIMIGEEDDEDPEDDDEEDPDDSGEDDDMEDLGDINADGENDSLVDGDEEDWQDEIDDGEGDDRTYDVENQDGSQDPDAEDAVRDIVREFGGAEAALQRLEGLDDAPSADLIMDIEEGRYMDDVVRRDEDDEAEDDEEDDDEVDDEEFDAVYDDDRTIPDPPWGWDDPDDEPFTHDHHHRHHHHAHRHHLSRHFTDPWTIFPGGPPRRAPLHQTHRTPTTGFRSNDDGTNPLLHRNDRLSTSGNPRRPAFSDAASSVGGVLSGPLGGPLGGPLMAGIGVGGQGIGQRENPVAMIHNLIAAIGRGDSGITAVPGPGGDLHIQIASDGSMDQASLHRGVQAMMAGTRFMQRQMHASDSGRSDVRFSVTAFVPQSTWHRWADEAKMLFGAGEVQNKGARVVNALLRLMVPPALEKKKMQDEEEKKRREELEKLREEERKLREESERIQREQREKEEAEAAAVASAAQAQAEAEAQAAAATRENEDTQEEAGALDRAEGAMEGVETNDDQAQSSVPDNGNRSTEHEQAEVPSSSQPTERQYVSFNGTQLDITDMGIDMAYLDALPEDIRNEVLMSQLAMQRAQTAAAGEAPTEIDNDFLEALPPDIRAELLQEEAQVRRRREREEARRQQASAGGTAHAEEMDPASFLASLDPQLRQHVLMEQDDEVLARLPAEIAAEARALGGDRSMHRFAGGPRITRPSDMRRDMLAQPPQAVKKQPRRQIVQMLDKPGVATLLRLMFMQQSSNVKNPLHGILHDVVQNRQNRAEVISLLLSLLQDGSTDVNAVERSYSQLSLRAKQVNAPRTPLKRTITDSSLISTTGIADLKITPLMVIQQCLGSLVFLTSHNQQHIPSFFLNENDASFTVKSKAYKKGKAKETKASKFPINALLSLLDRQLITENMSCIEQLANLLQKITYPLIILSRKDSDNPKDEKRVEASGPDQRLSTASPEAVSTESNDRNASESTNDATARSSTSPMADVQVSDTAEGHQSTNTVEDPTDIAANKTEEAYKHAENQPPKKPRTYVPPVIPEENLRLVVNIIVARECPSSTFRATLSTMTNLCAIAGSKEIFGKRLVDSALDLGHHVLGDLNELIPQIQGAASGTDLQGMALSKFSPQSSDQAKLLRVLKALDYLFDAKREDTQTKSNSETKDAVETSNASKADLVTSLYEDPTFALLWDKLGECLSAIRQATGMLNVATILLPLVEALMVVCTNTTIKETPIARAIKEFAITSPPPESRMESLFFRFTEEHRKILNDLVRQNPKLMSGTFQLLVRNPKVLEFDNKRSYFTRRLHQRGTETRHSQPPLQLSLRRDQVFRDSYQALFYKKPDEIKYGKLSIRFHGEEGVDAGGVTREWFQVLSRQMFNPDYALFIPVASDRTTFHPNKLSKINEEHLRFFNFIGRIIGKALYEGRALDCHFSRAVYKRILGKTVSIKDMETLDLDYYKSLLWMLENDITEIITETMCVETDDFGVTEVVDLVPNGRNVPVTEENKQEYVQLVVEHRLTGSVQAQLENFLEGFHDIVPPELIAIFNEQELELLISGLPDIDVDDWKNHTEYHNYQAASPQIQWFWRAVRSFDKEERAKLLQFVTGTSKVPLNGFGQLEGMNGFSRFNIHRDYGNKERLPSSHTCFNQLDLPEYEDYETLRKQVYLAMTAGSEYFGFA